MTRADVRPDLEEVFRGNYARVVATAARVLGSRDQAEDVAQEVFLSFGRSTIPAGEAGGWLTVAATHTALNLLRSGRRRSAREEFADDGPAVVPDVADLVVSREERSSVRAALARLPHKQRPRWCSGTAASATPRSPPPSNCPPGAWAPPCAAPSPSCSRS
jgi:DNA-directed RNA polymerase specialized sigma24 family protein